MAQHSVVPFIPAQEWPSIKYSTFVGFFAQDFPETDDSKFDYISNNFGLLDTFKLPGRNIGGSDVQEGTAHEPSKPKWGEFENAIKRMNQEAPPNIQYRVLYLARHGQGYNNVAKAFYGPALWESHWGLLDGDGVNRWGDAQLTEDGILQAQNANKAWKRQIRYGVPLPLTFYSSPLRRAAATLEITWSDITLNKKEYPKPIIKEKLHEGLGTKPRDRRRSKCEIARDFPKFTFEKGFTEDPPLDLGDKDINMRLKVVLDEIITSDDSTYITISTHRYTIDSILNIIGHRKFTLYPGGMIPVVVKVEFTASVAQSAPVDPVQYRITLRWLDFFLLSFLFLFFLTVKYM